MGPALLLVLGVLLLYVVASGKARKVVEAAIQ